MCLGKFAARFPDRVWDVGGRYLFVFQPAEEIVSGAKAMIAGGLLDEHHPDAVIGLHIVSFLESGTVVTKPGLLWAGSDAFDIGIAGPGGHGGMMGRAGNVLAAQAFLIERLHTIVDGLEHEGTNCHTTVGNVISDGAWNIVPRGVLVQGSVRTFNETLREQALDRQRLQFVELLCGQPDLAQDRVGKLCRALVLGHADASAAHHDRALKEPFRRRHRQ